MVAMIFNPFTDEQLNSLRTVPKQVCHSSSLYIFCLGCKTISRGAARRLIVLQLMTCRYMMAVCDHESVDALSGVQHYINSQYTLVYFNAIWRKIYLNLRER